MNTGTPSAIQSITVRNTGTTPTLTVSGVSVTNAAFSATTTCGANIAINATCTVSVRFTPTTIGETTATLVIAHNGTPAASNVALSGTGAAPVAVLESPLGPLDFGSEPAGTTAVSPPQFILLRNDGSADLVVSGVSVTGTDVGSFTTTTCTTVVPGNACTITVSFKPTTIGAKSASVRIAHNSNNVLTSTSTVPVRGIGTTSLATVSGPLVFTPVNTGATSATQAITLNNFGNANLVVSGVTLTGANPGEFAIINNGCTTVAPAATCTITVALKPTTFGAKTATVSIAHNSVGSPSTVALSGIGLAPVAAVAPASLAFGSVATGTSTTQNITVSNTGNANLVVSGVTITGGEFVASGCTGPVAAGGNCIIAVQFAPTTTNPQSATLSIAHNNNNVLGSTNTVALTGTGSTATAPAATVTPALLAFGTVTTGTTTAAQNITVSNSGSANLVVSSVTKGGTNPTEFNVVNNCTTVLPGANCTITVAFAPATAVAKSATISIAHNATGSPSSVTVSGTGGSIVVPAPVASVTPASLAFGSVTTGTTSATQSITVSNTGNANLVVSPVTKGGTNPTEFTVVTNNCTTVLPGTNCTITVAFAPATAAAKSATISIPHNAAASPSNVTVNGTGTALPPPVGSTQTFPASGVSTAIVIRDTPRLTSPAMTTASLYPAPVTVSGMTGTISKVVVKVNGLTHTFARDIDMILVGPGGQKVMLMSDAGGNLPINNGIAATLTFDDAAAGLLPATTVILPGTYKPTDIINGGTNDNFPTPGPAPVPAAPALGTATYVTPAGLGVFNGLSPNGTWNLYVVDDGSGDAGNISGGYAVTITTDGAAPAPAPVAAVSPASLAFGTVTTGTLSTTQNITVSNTGNANLSVSGVTLTGTNPTEFTVVTNGCTVAVAPAGNCIITVRFNPTTTGVKAAAVSIAHNARERQAPFQWAAREEASSYPLRWRQWHRPRWPSAR